MYKNIRCALETSVFISYFFRPARREKRGKEKSKTWLPGGHYISNLGLQVATRCTAHG